MEIREEKQRASAITTEQFLDREKVGRKGELHVCDLSFLVLKETWTDFQTDVGSGLSCVALDKSLYLPEPQER